VKWAEKLIEASFVKRYKRFFADCELRDGTPVTAHCPNTGSMRSCLREGAPVLIAQNQNPDRKLKYTLYAVKMPDGWVGVHTGIANKLVREAFESGLFPVSPSGPVKQEIKINDATRLDLFFRSPEDEDVYVEVKNTTLLLKPGTVAFPDAVTVRGKKHLIELMALKKKGARAILVFCAQRESARTMIPAWEDDPSYAETLLQAHQSGVEIYCARAEFSMTDIQLVELLPVNLNR
jgi:sugar fermentation stimulation protein A